MAKQEDIEVGDTVKSRLKLPKSFDLTGKTVFCDVFDEADAQDVSQSAAMASYGGKPYKLELAWSPDAAGQWHVEMYVEETAAPGITVFGPFVRNYDVGQFSKQSIGAQVATIESKVDNLTAATADDSDPVMLG